MASKRKTNPSLKPSRLILGNGHDLIETVTKIRKMLPPPFPRTFDEARDKVLSEVNISLERLRNLPQRCRRDDELVLCLRLHPDMLAKTYEPTHIFYRVPNIKNLGSRIWKAPLEHVKKTDRTTSALESGKRQAESRMIFVRGTEHGYRQLIQELNQPLSSLSKAFQQDIQKIERFDILDAFERLQGFEDWVEGRVELVFHPTRSSRETQLSFIDNLFEEYRVDADKVRISLYKDGPSFVSIPLDANTLPALQECNPLRSAHPLSSIQLQPIRSASGLGAPLQPNIKGRSSIIVGMFDGGVDTSVSAISPYVVQDSGHSLATLPKSEYVSHGTAVASAILFGSLDTYSANEPLPIPKVSVASFRVLPTSDPEDEDLYEVIDLIERVVPMRQDIKIFNLSIGPDGPIIEDQISRFTFALDRLAIERGVTFVCAVGNDGETQDYDRIQSPSDMVHGLGVGAYTFSNDLRTHAPYSCKGPGREGAKVKPDCLAFGGCEKRPFQVFDTGGNRAFTSGTSFAAPQASRLAGLVRGLFDQASGLLTRVLLAHVASHPQSTSDPRCGWGMLPDNWQDLLYTKNGSVTVVFQGTFVPGKYHVLPIPIPEKTELPGKVSFHWTIGALTPVNINHPGDYTTCCIEDTFHPDDRVHNYSFKDEFGKRLQRDLHEILHKDLIETLLKAGWKKSPFPITKGAKRSEQDLRSTDLKWDTLVKRQTVKFGNKLHKPCLVLHTMQRREEIPRFDYAVALTISAPQFEGDLYTEAVTRYPILQPIRLRAETDIIVNI